MQTHHDRALALTRRQFFARTATGIGALALSSLLNEHTAMGASASTGVPGILSQPHFAPRAKRIIYLFMQGGPSQMDLFDHKPGLARRHGEELPDSIRQGQRITGMTAKQSSLPVAPSPFKFAQHGRCGAWVSELLPHTGAAADDLCFVRSVNSTTRRRSEGRGHRRFPLGTREPPRIPTHQRAAKAASCGWIREKDLRKCFCGHLMTLQKNPAMRN